MLDNISIIIPVAPHETAHKDLVEHLSSTKAEIIVSSEGSRAKSLNEGAKDATREYLWFLHADSRISHDAIKALETAIQQKPNDLHYFDLVYDKDGAFRLNAYGANIRSRLLGLPYGDQGLCISKPLFNSIGGYPENVTYGEDLLFVRMAKRAGITPNHVPFPITTSARKYETHGWLRLTALRQWQFFKLMRQPL